MERCFVIQPFSEKYQKRYKDVYKNAIERAGLQPYKVDEDPGSQIPIETIEKEIKNTEICFVEITEDNPNVWFELGFAVANGSGCCIVCSKSIQKELPFDVRHRNVLFYDDESISDFVLLAEKITKRLQAILQQGSIVQRVAKDIAPSNTMQSHGFKSHEWTLLGLIAAQQMGVEDTVSVQSIQNSFSRSDFTETAFAIAMRRFEKGELVEALWEEGYQGEQFRSCRLTETGWDLILENEDRFLIKKPKSSVFNREVDGPREDFSADLNDEIPF